MKKMNRCKADGGAERVVVVCFVAVRGLLLRLVGARGGVPEGGEGEKTLGGKIGEVGGVGCVVAFSHSFVPLAPPWDICSFPLLLFTTRTCDVLRRGRWGRVVAGGGAAHWVSSVCLVSTFHPFLPPPPPQPHHAHSPPPPPHHHHHKQPPQATMGGSSTQAVRPAAASDNRMDEGRWGTPLSPSHATPPLTPALTHDAHAHRTHRRHHPDRLGAPEARRQRRGYVA